MYEVAGRSAEVCEYSDANTMKALSVTMTRLVKSSLSKKKVRKAMRMSKITGMNVLTTYPLNCRWNRSFITNVDPFTV